MASTWGSTIRRCNTDDERLEGYVNQSIKLWDEFQAVFPNILILANEVRATGVTLLWSGRQKMLFGISTLSGYVLDASSCFQWKLMDVLRGTLGNEVVLCTSLGH